MKFTDKRVDIFKQFNGARDIALLIQDEKFVRIPCPHTLTDELIEGDENSVNLWLNSLNT